ncbi:MAG: FAD-dependent tricarballylate dehydrogenase TcuA [Alphaproteobacteria bacterium]|nr:FAD-dependent tricarballylate dehydrogenase TcuA [Alphaproteobacteria bacterium]
MPAHRPAQTPNTKPDILVIGGGNAALTAALTAAETGASVTLLESAPEHQRGGNSRHTRNFRCAHSKPLDTLAGQYHEDEYLNDLLEVTQGDTDKELARLCIRNSRGAYNWMTKHGVRFQPPLSGTLSLARTNAFFLGGGKALLNAYYRAAATLGVEISYNSEVTRITYDGGRVTDVTARVNGADVVFAPRAVIAASGGFEADLEWLARVWGEAARNFIVRGTPHNRGTVLRELLDQGAESVGDPAQCHAVAVDGRAPKYDGGIVTRLDCVPFSAVVNRDGERFHDEGEDIWPKRYAVWGRLVAKQPGQVAYALIDSKATGLFMPSAFPPVAADTIEELARKLGLPARKVARTIETFNAACRPGLFRPGERDGLAAGGLAPPKSNWARPISRAPFYGYALRPGVTFTYLGVKVDAEARVCSRGGASGNLWAAGEIMAGSLLGRGYLAGFGMTIGTVFGRLAGEGAARYVR